MSEKDNLDNNIEIAEIDLLQEDGSSELKRDAKNTKRIAPRKPDAKKDEKSRRPQAASEAPEFMEKVVKVDRVTKVCKGGKRLAFRVLIIVGNQKGKVGIGLGKAKEVPLAIKKAIVAAHKNMIQVDVSAGTPIHVLNGKYNSSVVLVKPAPVGTGIIAGGSVRVVLEAAGFGNVVAKCVRGSSNPITLALATLEALSSQKNLKLERKRRGVNFSVSFKNREVTHV